MKGRVFQRKRSDGSFYEMWSAVVGTGIDPASGRRRQLTKSNAFKTKREGWAWVRSVLKDIDSGSYVTPNELTVGQYLQEWLESARTQVRPSTWLSYASYANTQIIPRLGSVPLQQLKPTDLKQLYLALGRIGARKDGVAGGLSSRTIRYIHAILRLALSDAVAEGLVQSNVATAVKPPKLVQDEMKHWTGEEARRFLTCAAQDRLYAAWALTLSTGMRKGEVLGLRWKDIDLEGANLTVSQTLVSVGSRSQFSTPKTDAGRRRIDLDAVTVRILKAHKSQQAEEKLTWGPAYRDTGLVFTREDGEIIKPWAFGNAFQRLVKQSGVTRIRLHDCRHTYASLALQQNVNILVVSKRLGHSSVAFTLDIYGHLMPGQQIEAANKVAAVLFGEAL